MASGWTLTLVGLLMALAIPVQAMPVGFDVGEGRLNVTSRRISRGYDLAKGLGLASSLRIGLAGFDVSGTGRTGLSAELQAAAPLHDRAHQGSADEFDVGLWLSHTFDGHRQYEGRLGFIEANYLCGRAGIHHARELSGTLVADWQVNEALGFRCMPHVTMAYEFAAFDAAYGEVGLGQSVGTRGKRLTMDFRLSVSRFGRYGEDGRQPLGFHDAECQVGAELERQLGAIHLLYGPICGVSRAAKRINDHRQQFWWGASLGFRR